MMRILLGYSYYERQDDVRAWVEKWLGRLNQSGIEIAPFCLTLDAPGPRLSWKELDEKWKTGDNKLYTLYENLLEECKNYDVFINWNGINLHPEFVSMMPILKVYSCFDDPESSEDLSKPVAKAYDLCLVGNIAEVNTYKEWGVENAEFWPLGFFEDDYDNTITEEQIIGSERDVDITLLCERVSGWRSDRLDLYSQAFPQGHYHGRGWENGFLDGKDKIPLYKRTKIGPNFHNSTGPINYRTYVLPANGVMLLCDNKSHLAKLYKLGEEAVGFDTIEEAIELTKYYLTHDDERKRIAVAGWKRSLKDYNEVASFNVGLKHISKLPIPEKDDVIINKVLKCLKKRQRIARMKYWFFMAFFKVLKKVFLKILRKKQ